MDKFLYGFIHQNLFGKGQYLINCLLVQYQKYNIKGVFKPEPKMMKTNLKRDRRSFQSTALQSLQTSRTVPRSYQPINSVPSQLEESFKTISEQISKRQAKYEYNDNVKSILQTIALNICDEHNRYRREVNSKNMRHFYYRGISRTAINPLINVPKVVIELYNKQQIKRNAPSSPPVSYSQGFLPNANCLYYSIQNTLVLVPVRQLMDCNDPTFQSVPYIIHQVRNQMVGENPLFPGYQLILAINHPWQLQFYAWQYANIPSPPKSNKSYSDLKYNKESGLKALNYIYNLPIEKVKAIDCTRDGRIFFFDEQGALHQISPQRQTKLMIYKTGKYSIKNYINSSKNTFQLLSNKHGKFSPLFNIASCVTQASKYLFPAKIQAKIVVVDERRKLVFGLLQKKIQLLFGHQNQIFIVCYNIQSKSKLLHKFSQKFFIQKFSTHIHGQKKIDFIIHSIKPAPIYYENANLSIITQSNIQIILQITQNDAKIVQIIRPPDHRMFQIDLSNIENNTQFPPLQKSQYKLMSFIENQQKTICTVKNKGNILTYLTSNTVCTGTIDISQQANQINIDIYKEGQRNVKIYNISSNKLLYLLHQNIIEQNEGYISELTEQILRPPSVYLFQGQLTIQIMSYIRPIDVLFTALSVIVMEGQNMQRVSQNYLTKEKFILKLFINQALNFSLVGNSFINVQQLCSMLIQIIADKDGMYYYSSQAAKQIIKMWHKIRTDRYGQIINDTYKFQGFDNFEKENYQKMNSQLTNRNVPKQYQIRVGSNELLAYNKISNKLFNQCKQLLQKLSIQGPSLMYKQISRLSGSGQTFYDFNDFPFELSKIPKVKIIQFKIGVILRYLSRLLQQIWNTRLTQIKRQIRLAILTKLQHIYTYAKQTQTQNKIYQNLQDKQNQHINKQSTQLLTTISRLIQLLLLIQHLPLLPKQNTFSECIKFEKGQFQQYMFQAIHKQYKPFIINKWQSLFPSFVTHDFVKLVRAYGEIQQIPTAQIIVQQLRNKANILKLTPYFLNYLYNVRRLTSQQINQIIAAYPKQIIPDSDLGNDFQFIIPQKIKQMKNKYGKSGQQLNQSDAQQLKNILQNKYDLQKLTISNKLSIVSYIKMHLPMNQQILYLCKCISMQYQVYRYYLKQIQNNQKQMKNKNNNILVSILSKKNKQENIKQNQQTMVLLRFTTIVDQQKLKKLIWITANFKLMSQFCLTFKDLEGLKVVFKQICKDYSNPKNKGYSSLATYLQSYILNFTLKSDFSPIICQLICEVVDEYLVQTPYISNMLLSWMQFNSLTSITDRHIWLPQMLITQGYSPILLFNIYKNSLQSQFQKSIPFINQLLYGFKLLNCYVIADKKLASQRKQICKIIMQQLDALYKNNCIEHKTMLAIKKMLDELVAKPIHG